MDIHNLFALQKSRWIVILIHGLNARCCEQSWPGKSLNNRGIKTFENAIFIEQRKFPYYKTYRFITVYRSPKRLITFIDDYTSVCVFSNGNDEISNVSGQPHRIFLLVIRDSPSISPESLSHSLARSVSLWIFAHVDRVFISACWWLLLRIHQPFFSRLRWSRSWRSDIDLPRWHPRNPSRVSCFIRIAEELKDIAPLCSKGTGAIRLQKNWKLRAVARVTLRIILPILFSMR